MSNRIGLEWSRAQVCVCSVWALTWALPGGFWVSLCEGSAKLSGQGEELLYAEMNRVPGSQSTESVKRLPANTEMGLTTVWPPQGEIDKFQQNAVCVSTNEWGWWWKGGGKQLSECRGQDLHKAIPGTLHLFMLMTRRCITRCKLNENQGTKMFTRGLFFLTDKSSVVESLF